LDKDETLITQALTADLPKYLVGLLRRHKGANTGVLSRADQQTNQPEFEANEQTEHPTASKRNETASEYCCVVAKTKIATRAAKIIWGHFGINKVNLTYFIFL